MKTVPAIPRHLRLDVAVVGAFLKRVAFACLGSVLLSHASAFAAAIATGPFTPSATSPFIVPIEVSGAVSLDSFTFDLAYDPAAYRINTACDPFSDGYCDFSTGPITLGTFYTDAATVPSLFDPGFILLDGSGNQTGQLIGVNGAWQDFTAAPSGDGVFAFIEFVALPGVVPTFPIAVVGSPVVPPPGGTVSEPDPLMLIVSGFVVAGLRRRHAGGRRVRGFS